jgi:hypothetical protein
MGIYVIMELIVYLCLGKKIIFDILKSMHLNDEK